MSFRASSPDIKSRSEDIFESPIRMFDISTTALGLEACCHVDHILTGSFKSPVTGDITEEQINF